MKNVITIQHINPVKFDMSQAIYNLEAMVWYSGKTPFRYWFFSTGKAITGRKKVNQITDRIQSIVNCVRSHTCEVTLDTWKMFYGFISYSVGIGMRWIQSSFMKDVMDSRFHFIVAFIPLYKVFV